MKKLLFFTLIFLFAGSLGLCAAPSSEKLNELIENRKKMDSDIAALREKLISEDPAISKIYKKVNDLEKELSDTLDSKPDMKELKKKNPDALMEIHQLKMKILRDDPDLNQIHKKIVTLHRELALKIENNREMKELVKRSKALESEINKQIDDRKDSND